MCLHGVVPLTRESSAPVCFRVSFTYPDKKTSGCTVISIWLSFLRQASRTCIDGCEGNEEHEKTELCVCHSPHMTLLSFVKAPGSVAFLFNIIAFVPNVFIEPGIDL